jgi:hypothetical protein
MKYVKKNYAVRRVQVTLNVLAVDDLESCMNPKFTDAHDISLFNVLAVPSSDTESKKSKS